MNTKAIFLDIDGVINTNLLRASKECLFHHCFQYGLDLTLDRLNLDQRLIDILFTAISDDVDIVISSMWRFGAKHEWFTQLFALYGKTVSVDRIKFIRCDELEEFDGQRQDFIEQFLQIYPYEQYVAIDDTDSHYHPDCNYVVFTDRNIGVTEYNITQLLKILHRK